MLKDFLERARRLSIRARLAVALRCFEGYCHQRKLAHEEIDAFVNNLWAFLSVESGATFHSWEKTRPALIDTALGEEYPAGFEDFLNSAGADEHEFRCLLSSTTEIVFGSLYGAAQNEESLRFLDWVVETAQRYGVEPPPLDAFASSRWEDGYGWGKRASTEQVQQWRQR